MPILSSRITDKTARGLSLPVKPASGSAKEFYLCPVTPGFGIRVSSSGDMAYTMERRIDGKNVRRTIGKAAGAGAISADAARKLQVTLSSELQQGVDRTLDRVVARAIDKADSLTLADAVLAYVKGKRRAKDGLALKERTKNDYLAMVTRGGTKSTGEAFIGGPLATLADKPIHRITAADIHAVYSVTLKRSQRQATYAMQVLRAVLNYQGVTVADSPLSKATAGKNRIVLPPTKGKQLSIPPEKLGDWWRAATAKAGNVSADGCRFILLTGCRPGEIFGDKFNAGLLVGNVDLEGNRIKFIDTKNRTDHTIPASEQVFAIVEPLCKGRKATDKVFTVVDPGKTLETINRAAGVVGITPHKLRHTFASVAEDLVSAYALKRMMNHSDNGDVTSGYIGKSEAQLRSAWQTVADAIDDFSGKKNPSTLAGA